MSEEIKEILDRLDFNEWEVDLYKVPITWTELYDVRDYITNLQKENKRLNNIINEARKKINSMFDNGDETRIIEDLLELNKILKNYKAKENNK